MRSCSNRGVAAASARAALVATAVGGDRVFYHWLKCGVALRHRRLPSPAQSTRPAAPPRAGAMPRTPRSTLPPAANRAASDGRCGGSPKKRVTSRAARSSHRCAAGASATKPRRAPSDCVEVVAQELPRGHARLSASGHQRRDERHQILRRDCAGQEKRERTAHQIGPIESRPELRGERRCSSGCAYLFQWCRN